MQPFALLHLPFSLPPNMVSLFHCNSCMTSHLIAMSHSGILYHYFVGYCDWKTNAYLYNHLKYNWGKKKSEPRQSKLRAWVVIPSDKWLWVFRNFKRITECHDVFDVYDILRQRTLRIFLRGEVLQ